MCVSFWQDIGSGGDSRVEVLAGTLVLERHLAHLPKGYVSNGLDELRHTETRSIVVEHIYDLKQLIKITACS